MNVIRFFSTSREYGEFSNFAPYPIRLKRKTWPTVEHYFQAQKFAGTPHEHVIRRAKSPAIAKQLGRTRRPRIRPDWEAVKDAIMYDAVKAKFTQHADLRALLLATGNATLVEHAPYDAVVVTCAATHVPPALIEQLKPGGRICIPVGPAFGTQDLVVVTKQPDGTVRSRSIIPVRFVPLVRTPEPPEDD